MGQAPAKEFYRCHGNAGAVCRLVSQKKRPDKPNHISAPSTLGTVTRDYTLAEGIHRSEGQSNPGPNRTTILAG